MIPRTPLLALAWCLWQVPCLTAQARAEPTITIGTWEHPETQVFGIIADVVPLADGRIAVLDSRMHILRIFAPDGTFLMETGGTGSGPGEFLLPAALAVIGDTLYVLDRRAGRISEFTTTDTLRYADSRPASGNLHDLCAVNGDLYGLGYLDGQVIHHLSRGSTGWTPQRSFGAAEHENVLIAIGFSNGFLACDAPRGIIAWASRQAGTVAAFTSAGVALWSHTLEGFVRMRITAQANGRVAYEYPNDEQWHHMIAGLAINDGSVRVTFGRSSPRVAVDDDPEDLAYRDLHLNTGTVSGTGPSRGVMRALDSRHRIMWSTTTRPYPRIVGSHLGTTP